MTTYRVPADVLRAPVADDEVLYNPQTGVYHLLNATGRDLLGSIEEGADLEEAARRLSERTGEAPDRVLADARRFASDLLERGLLVEDAG